MKDFNEFNKKCAEFLGFEKYPIKDKSDGYIVNFHNGFVPFNSSIGSLGFHLDLNKLDHVINKILRLGYVVKITSSPTISGKWFGHSFVVSKNEFTFKDQTFVKYDSDYNNNESRLNTIVKGIDLFIDEYNNLK